MKESVIGGAYEEWGDQARTRANAPEFLGCWEDHPEAVAGIEAAAETLKSF